MSNRNIRSTFWPALFALVLIFSFLILAVYVFSGAGAGSGGTTTTPITQPGIDQTSATVSLLTSIVSLVGLVSTMALNWRKEFRERKEFELENERIKIELEKTRLEIERLKSQ